MERFDNRFYRTASDAAEVEAEKADAARYRFLRSRDLDTIKAGGVFAGMTPKNVILSGGDLDQAVDAAMGRQTVPPLDPWDMIERLRADEGNMVMILCDNPNFEGPNSALVCCGEWTNWLDQRFTGDTVRAALKAACKAMRGAKRAGAAEPITDDAAADFTERRCARLLGGEQ